MVIGEQEKVVEVFAQNRDLVWKRLSLTEKQGEFLQKEIELALKAGTFPRLLSHEERGLEGKNDNTLRRFYLGNLRGKVLDHPDKKTWVLSAKVLDLVQGSSTNVFSREMNDGGGRRGQRSDVAKESSPPLEGKQRDLLAYVTKDGGSQLAINEDFLVECAKQLECDRQWVYDSLARFDRRGYLTFQRTGEGEWCLLFREAAVIKDLSSTPRVPSRKVSERKRRKHPNVMADRAKRMPNLSLAVFIRRKEEEVDKIIKDIEVLEARRETITALIKAVKDNL